MSRYIDRTIAMIAGIVLLAVIGYYGRHVIVRTRALNREIAAAQRLQERADQSKLAVPEKDPAKYAGRVFKAWEEIPLARTFHVADFYPGSR